MTKPADLIQLTSQPLSIADAVAALYDPLAGGIDVFLGTTRRESTADGVELIALDYEAYEQMAVEQMHQLLASARSNWPIVRCVLLHRLGRVPLGQPSVLIGVACPHRPEAFEACRYLIDELKKTVTIWKKEIWTQGGPTWVHPARP